MSATRQRWSCMANILLFCALLSAVRGMCAQDSVIAIGTAEYINLIYDTNALNLSPTNFPGPNSTSVALFSGNVSAYNDAPTETNSMAHRLVLSAFGQPVAATPLRPPDFLLGQEIAGPAGFSNY